MSRREFDRRPMSQFSTEYRDGKRNAFAGYDRCPDCNALPNAPCRDTDWGRPTIRDRAHPARPKLEEA